MATLERWLDRAEPMRAGEELDLEPLARHLREHVPEIGAQTELSVHQFPSGHSNLTYLISAGDRQYVLRRPPFGSRVKTAHMAAISMVCGAMCLPLTLSALKSFS